MYMLWVVNLLLCPSANQTRIIIHLSLFLLALLWGPIVGQIGIEEYQNRAQWSMILATQSVNRTRLTGEYLGVYAMSD